MKNSWRIVLYCKFCKSERRTSYIVIFFSFWRLSPLFPCNMGRESQSLYHLTSFSPPPPQPDCRLPVWQRRDRFLCSLTTCCARGSHSGLTTALVTLGLCFWFRPLLTKSVEDRIYFLKFIDMVLFARQPSRYGIEYLYFIGSVFSNPGSSHFLRNQSLVSAEGQAISKCP